MSGSPDSINPESNRGGGSCLHDQDPCSKAPSFLADLVPRGGTAILCLAGALAFSLSYWVVAAIQHPGESLDLLAMYRYGDIQFYPIFKALGDSQLGEAVVYEEIGQGVRTYPFFAMIFHAVALRLFGAAGFIVADFLVAGLYFISIHALVRVVGARRWIALAAALAASLCCHQGEEVASESTWAFMLWSLRLMRPFVTNLYLVGSLTWFCLLLYRGRFLGPRIWALFGVTLALQVQGDLYSAFPVAFSMPVVVTWLWLRGRGQAPLAWKRVGVFGLFLALAMGPFLIQRILENPEVPRRLGVFAVDRFPPLWESYKLGQFAALILVFPAAVTWVLRRWPLADLGPRLAVVWGLTLVSAVSYVSLPLSSAVLGRTVQPYHFETSFCAFTGYQFLVTCALLLDSMLSSGGTWAPIRALSSLLSRGAVRVALASAFVILGVTMSVTIHARQGGPSHMRDDFHEYGSLTGYRDDFDALTEELRRPLHAGRRVPPSTISSIPGG